MEIDISREKNQLLKAIKFKIFVYKDLREKFISRSTLIPVIPLYAEFLFLSSTLKLQRKLKNLEIILYKNPIFLIDLYTLSFILLISSIFYIFFSLFVIPFILCFLDRIIKYLYIDYMLGKYYQIFLYINFIIIGASTFFVWLLFTISIFLWFLFAALAIGFNIYKDNMTLFCQGLYQLTNNELFNECAIDFVNIKIDWTDLTDKQLKIFEKLYNIKNLPEKITLLQIK